MVRKRTILLLGFLLFVAACTPPSEEGIQGKLRASVPVTGEVVFE